MMDGPGQGLIAVGAGLGRGWRGLGAGAGRWRQREPGCAGWSSQCAGCQAHLAPWMCDVPERSPWCSQYWCCPALGHGPVPGSQPALSPSPVQPPSTHSFSQEGSGVAEHPVSAGTPPDEGEGLAGLGRGVRGSLPAGLVPSVCHDAFIRATESPPGNMATLWRAGLVPGKGCPSPAPALPGVLTALCPS